VRVGKRFITGVDSGKSRLLAQEKVGVFSPYEILPCFQIHELFYTEDDPQSLATRHLVKTYNIDLPKGAMRIMVVRMPTIKEMELDMIAASQPIPDDWSKHNIHNTDSVDYLFVLSGAIKCVTGEDTFELNQGDFLAQVGPEHTWVNPHDEACYILCIMVGTQPSGNRKQMAVE
jgi:mannose-6-phosphate isomerase-like protein (cupin superfamily)